MFLNTEKEILEALKLYCINNINFINRNIEFIKIDNEIIVNFNASNISLPFELKELNIKFGIIKGDFKVNSESLESFKGFPINIDGNLMAVNSSFKDGKDWKIKKINGGINICGSNCELTNLDFLKNTDFQFIDLKIYDSIFKKNLENDFMNIFNNKFDNKFFNNILYKKDLNEYIKLLNIHQMNEKDVNNYLESFDIIEKDIK